MITKIIKIGNSKGLILPSEVIKALSLDEGDAVELTYNANTQILTADFVRTKQLKLAVK